MIEGEVDAIKAEVGKSHGFFGVDNQCFKLGEKVFEAIEDKDDGYRSYLESIIIRDPTGLVFFQTPIATVTVVAYEKNSREGFQLVDDGGHVWLDVGTDLIGDYYPFFVFDYTPKACVTIDSIESVECVVGPADASGNTGGATGRWFAYLHMDSGRDIETTEPYEDFLERWLENG